MIDTLMNRPSPSATPLLARWTKRALRGAGVALASLLMWATPVHAQALNPLVVVKASSFTYDADGMLTSETVEPDDPQACLTTVYTYDQYGNKATSTSSPCAGATGYALASATQNRTASHSITVLAGGGVTSVSRNAKGHTETRTSEPRFGGVEVAVNASNNTSRQYFDGMGRTQSEVRIDGNWVNWEYKLCTEAGAQCPVAVGNTPVVRVSIEKRAGIGGADVRTYYDMLSRVVRIETQGFDGAAPGPAQYKDAHFNATGHVARQTDWYAASGGIGNFTDFEYDELGRVVKQTYPDPDTNTGVAISTIEYSGLSTKIRNPRSHLKTTLKNAQGHVAKVIDHQGNEVRYTYDAIGNLIATNAAGVTTAMSYNQRGQKITMQDPAMGSWQYQYNVYGEMVWQSDSLGRTTTMAYDVLGRTTARNEADLTSTWTFDNTRVGALGEAASSNGYKRVQYYTSTGLAYFTRIYAENPTQPTDFNFKYDSYSRLIEKNWPSGYRATYDYTPLGFLKKVSGNVYTNPTWETEASYEVLEMDAHGRVTKYKYGNQIITTKTWDPLTNKLRAIDATNYQGSKVKHAYAYDELGNLKERWDQTPGFENRETFSYDALDRLDGYAMVGSAVSPPTAVQVKYDARGNITYRSDVGTYQYDLLRPNRLTNITLDTPAGAMANSGTRLMIYGYDDALPGATTQNGRPMGNGNVMYTESQDTRAGGRHSYRLFSYNSFNMVQSIAHGNVAAQTGCATGACIANLSMAYVYGPEHQRIKQVVVGGADPGTTWYYNGPDNGGLNYEVQIRNGWEREQRHFLTAGGVTFAVITLRNSGAVYKETKYLHHDYLGSAVAVTDLWGTVQERMAYDPWGKRRFVNGNADVLDSIAGVQTDRGFTMHEHLDDIGLINMNARMYDPLTGRFLSADPFIQSPDNLQSYNRYSYVLNNPLAFTDPSGYFSVIDLYRIVVQAVVTAYAGPQAGAAVSAALDYAETGSFADAFKTGIVSWGTAAGFGWAKGFSGAQLYMAHALVGCVSTTVGGGKCGQGAAAAVFGKFVSMSLDAKFSDPVGTKVVNGILTAIAGGVGSRLTGGKFDDGALTAAMGYLFNAISEKDQAAWRKGGCLSPTIVCVQQNADFQKAVKAMEVDQALGTICVVCEVAGVVRTAKGGFALWESFAAGSSVSRVALTSAQEAYKGSTVVGHSLSKHAGRNPDTWGKMSGSMKTWNDQAMVHFRDIAGGPGEFSTVTRNGISFLEKRLGDGRGMRLNMNGSFKTFLD